MSSDRETPKGITRINIIGSQIARADEARRMWTTADALYHRIFDGYIAPGSQVINCTLDEFKAGYDKFLGIDVLLTFANGMTLTLQEKFLTTTFYTVTVEYFNDPTTGDLGDWCELKAQLYFVGYYTKKRPQDGFTKWVLLDWPMTVLETQRDRIPWQTRGNTMTAARANFKFVAFDKLPKSCIAARSF